MKEEFTCRRRIATMAIITPTSSRSATTAVTPKWNSNRNQM